MKNYLFTSQEFSLYDLDDSGERLFSVKLWVYFDGYNYNILGHDVKELLYDNTYKAIELTNKILDRIIKETINNNQWS